MTVYALLTGKTSADHLREVANRHSDLAKGKVKGARSTMYDERYFEQLSLTIFKYVTVM